MKSTGESGESSEVSWGGQRGHFPAFPHPDGTYGSCSTLDCSSILGRCSIPGHHSIPGHRSIPGKGQRETEDRNWSDLQRSPWLFSSPQPLNCRLDIVGKIILSLSPDWAFKENYGAITSHLKPVI